LCQLRTKDLSVSSNQTNILLGITNSSISDVTNRKQQHQASGSTSSSSKKPHKTPLKLNNSNKKPLHMKTNDRFIPNRLAFNMEASYHLLVNVKSEQENIDANVNDSSVGASDTASSSLNGVDNVKRKLLSDTCQGVLNEKDKILNLHTKQNTDSIEQTYAAELKQFYNNCSSVVGLKKTTLRYVNPTPEKILDAPDFRNDFYLNLIDWSKSNQLAVALNQEMYIWNATNKEISQLFAMDEETDDFICSVSWIQKGHVLAVGTSRNTIELWDVNKQVCLRQMKSHTSRVGSLAWNQHVLTSGGRSGEIHHHDVRVAQHHVGSFKKHTQEVCGLKWSNDGRYLASGANDNLACVWDSTLSLDYEEASDGRVVTGQRPLCVLSEHTAAVKAIAWCPWQSNILATGGGTADGKIHIWNIYNGSVVQSQDARSQISCLLWSKQYKELVSSHGFQQNQLTIWKYPEMSKVCDLTGHTNRILMMSMSPDEETIASVSADETLRLWKCFPADERAKKSKETPYFDNKSLQTTLTTFIR
jgi:cell division cycle protein 20 (cofactor of APC complex)